MRFLWDSLTAPLPALMVFLCVASLSTDFAVIFVVTNIVFCVILGTGMKQWPERWGRYTGNCAEKNI